MLCQSPANPAHRLETMHVSEKLAPTAITCVLAPLGTTQALAEGIERSSNIGSL